MAVMPLTPGLTPDAAIGGPFTVHDLETMPDDGHRYELIDGSLVVTPAPGWGHQEAAGASYRELFAACPPDLRVLIGPFAIQLAIDTELQPDVLVARYSDLTPRNLPVAPVLAIEVASPSTRLIDRNLKKAAFAKFGTPSYWLIDPDIPRLTAYDLEGGDFVEVAHVTGDEVFVAERPFRARLVPTELIRGLSPPPG